MRKKLNKALSFLIGAATLVSIGFGTAGQKVEAAEGKAAAYKEVIEFEDANNFEQNGQNYIDSSMFHGYSGSGYVYLVSGWSEVNFNIPQSGDYKITVVTNADSYKENWWYLDETQSGALLTSGNQWEPYTVTSYLSAGWHKFGVSAEWGYTALDYCVIESASGGSIVPEGRSMYVKDGRLYDADGDDFIMRGVNVAHAWYTDKTWTSINAIADRGANCVRVVLADGSQWGKTSRQEVENIIAWCEERGLICILEVHDHTGFDEASRLQNAVNYWIALRDLVNAHKDYVIVNIANEWLGTWGMSSHWASTYESAIKTLRNEGIQNVLMIDTSGYGQETSTCIDNCQRVLNADPMKNTMFSFHLYSVAGKDAQTVRNGIDAMLSKGVAFCIGEFGNWQNGTDVDEYTIMQYCTEKGIGYAAWSWKGNSGIDTPLDMAADWKGSSLSDWGNYVFYAGQIGICATSALAYP